MEKNDKRKKDTQMNDMIPESAVTEVVKKKGGRKIIPLDDTLDDGEDIIKDPRDDEYVKDVIAYNQEVKDSVGAESEKSYSQEGFDPGQGGIIIRLFRKIPCRQGTLVGFQVVPNTQMKGNRPVKQEPLLDPYHFENIGVIVNYDSEYDKKNELAAKAGEIPFFSYKVGDVVQLNSDVSRTVIDAPGQPPYIKGVYFAYNEMRNLRDTGYVMIRSNSITGKIKNFDLDAYTEDAFRKPELNDNNEEALEEG